MQGTRCELQLTKAKSQSAVLTGYRHLVRKGQDQFSRELEQLLPDVKIGESAFVLPRTCQLTWQLHTLLKMSFTTVCVHIQCVIYLSAALSIHIVQFTQRVCGL